MSAPKTISGHLKDLGKRDIMVAYDCVQWLAPTQREIARRSRPKRLANRYIAACMIVGAAENPAMSREVLDRTEGKVPDRLIGELNKSVNIRIELAGSSTHQESIEGQCVSETDTTALTVVDSKTST